MSTSSGKTTHLAVVCTGTRSDVLQHVALAAGLLRLGGFRVKLVTHAVYEAMAKGLGLGFAGLKGDPSALLKTSAFREGVASGNVLTIAAQFKQEADTHITANLALIHDACKGVDGILCSIAVLTECMAVSQKYQKPLLLVPLLPYSKSGELPLATLVSEPFKYKFLNKLSYDLSGTLLWSVWGATYNRFRVGTLNIGPQSHYELEGVPQVAAFSPAAVPRPADWGSHIHMTNVWVLPEGDAEDGVRQFNPRLHAAMSSVAGAEVLKRPLVCAFESTPLPDPVHFLRTLHDVAARAGVIGVWLAGDTDVTALRGSARLEGLDILFEVPGLPPPPATAPKRPEPANPRVFVIGHAPYTWLFPRASTVVHQGGAQITQLALMAGVPSIAFPAYGDQHFWAARVCTLGVGPTIPFPMREVCERLPECVGIARQQSIVAAAASVGGALREAGDGVAMAVATIRDVLSRPQHRHCGVTCSWEPDESRQSCGMCEQPFTLLNRRRHCRSCGKLACTKCLVQRCHLPGYPEDAPQLCCERCLDQRRAFFAMHVGESACPDLPASAFAGGGAGGSGARSAAAPTAVASVGSAIKSTAAVAALPPGFGSVDLLSGSGSAATPSRPEAGGSSGGGGGGGGAGGDMVSPAIKALLSSPLTKMSLSTPGGAGKEAMTSTPI